MQGKLVQDVCSWIFAPVNSNSDLRPQLKVKRKFEYELIRHFLQNLRIGADGGTRTRKPIRARDFKSLVYTNSTTSAGSGYRCGC